MCHVYWDIMKESVGLAGKAEDVGFEYGCILGERARSAVRTFEKTCRERGYDPDILARKRLRFEEIVSGLAPWWIEEYRGFARAIDVDEERFSTYQAVRDVSPGFLTGCTSYIVRSSDSMLIHKNRDFTVGPQSLFVKQIEGTYGYIGSVEAGNTGTAYFLNEKGLCCVSNTGSPTNDLAPAGITEHLVMRLLAETCSDCDEALDMIRSVVSDGIFTSASFGVIFLIADRESAMVVEATRSSMEFAQISENAARANLFLLQGMKEQEGEISEKREQSSVQRLARCSQRIAENGMSLRRAQEISRDAKGEFPLCGERTVSAMNVLLPADPGIPPAVWYCAGSPRYSCYIPVSSRSHSVPRFCADGSLWEISRSLQERNIRIDHAEWDARMLEISKQEYSEELCSAYADDVYTYMKAEADVS